MKVLHIYKDYPPVRGGIEGHLRDLAEFQVGQGIEVSALVTSQSLGGSVRYENGVRVIRAGRLASLASTPLSLSLLNWRRRLEADVTHLHSPYPFGEIAHLVCGRSKVTVTTYHCNVERFPELARLYVPIARRALDRSDRILVSSPQLRDSAPLLQPFLDKCSVVPFGIDPERFQSDSATTPRGSLQEISGPMILFVGRLRHYKGIETLIESMAEVSATLVIAGAGPMERRWRRQAESSAASERILFLGEVSDGHLAQLYRSANLLVLPSTSRAEAFGVVQLEAMAAGIPVVSTELGTGTSFVNQHGETGLVVPPGDVRALAAALSKLLDRPRLRDRLGRGARERLLSHFQIGRMAEEIKEIYTRALEASTRPHA